MSAGSTVFFAGLYVHESTAEFRFNEVARNHLMCVCVCVLANRVNNRTWLLAAIQKDERS